MAFDWGQYLSVIEFEYRCLASRIQPAVLHGERVAGGAASEERSSSPCSPSAHRRASHVASVRTLTPAAVAASATHHQPASPRSTSRRRLRRQVPRVTVKLHTGLLELVAWQLQASGEARLNNLLRNYKISRRDRYLGVGPLSPGSWLHDGDVPHRLRRHRRGRRSAYVPPLAPLRGRAGGCRSPAPEG